MILKYTQPLGRNGIQKIMNINPKDIREIISLKLDNIRKTGIKNINLYPQFVKTKKTKIYISNDINNIFKCFSSSCFIFSTNDWEKYVFLYMKNIMIKIKSK